MGFLVYNVKAQAQSHRAQSPKKFRLVRARASNSSNFVRRFFLDLDLLSLADCVSAAAAAASMCLCVCASMCVVPIARLGANKASDVNKEPSLSQGLLFELPVWLEAVSLSLCVSLSLSHSMSFSFSSFLFPCLSSEGKKNSTALFFHRSIYFFPFAVTNRHSSLAFDFSLSHASTHTHTHTYAHTPIRRHRHTHTHIFHLS